MERNDRISAEQAAGRDAIATVNKLNAHDIGVIEGVMMGLMMKEDER